MESDERDVEIFERIPWESLEKPGDRRRMVYLAAIALVMVAVGVTVGRGMAPSPAGPPATAPTSSSTVISLPAETSPTLAPTSSVAPELPTTWSEADLMAVPAESLEAVASAMAEWFVVDYFTRDGESEGGDRSFVEWSSVVSREWASSSVLDLTVVLRRLAAAGADAYQRVPVEGWQVSLELGDDGWVVIEGPVSVPAPDLAVALVDLEAEPPPAVVEAVQDGEVGGGVEEAGGWLVEVDWTDAAGLSWDVRRRVEPET